MARGERRDVRDAITVETKTFNPMTQGADHGLSATDRRQVESSLERLGLERLPLYMAHDFDPDTPQEETLSTLDELVREGKVGASVRPTSPPSSWPRRSRSRSSRARPLRVGAELVLAPRLRRRRDALSGVREHGLGYEAFGPSQAAGSPAATGAEPRYPMAPA
jgi:aryl-alcohol dehydrogenase-like predicted oxidoreductase